MITLYLFGACTYESDIEDIEIVNEITLFIIMEGTPSSLTISVEENNFDTFQPKQATNKRGRTEMESDNHPLLFLYKDETPYAKQSPYLKYAYPFSRKIIYELEDMNNLQYFEPQQIQKKIAETKHTRIVIIYNSPNDLTVTKLSRDMNRLIFFTFPCNKPIFFYRNCLDLFDDPLIMENILLHSFFIKT